MLATGAVVVHTVVAHSGVGAVVEVLPVAAELVREGGSADLVVIACRVIVGLIKAAAGRVVPGLAHSVSVSP